MLRPACAYVCMALDLHVSFSKNVLFHKFKLVLSVKYNTNPRCWLHIILLSEWSVSLLSHRLYMVNIFKKKKKRNVSVYLSYKHKLCVCLCVIYSTAQYSVVADHMGMLLHVSLCLTRLDQEEITGMSVFNFPTSVKHYTHITAWYLSTVYSVS